jgi:putative tryptophan/tyrosine transport system substrate-binding protein
MFATTLRPFIIADYQQCMCSKEAVEDGGLMSYGADIPDVARLACKYATKILNGAKPSDLPVQQPVKFELAINLKTAEVLSLTIPSALLTVADEVIE